jgi:error-prone DNA polymerase
MTTEERLVTDFASTGLTLEPHPMAYHRTELNHDGITPAANLCRIAVGTYTRIAGAVVARRRLARHQASSP